MKQHLSKFPISAMEISLGLAEWPSLSIISELRCLQGKHQGLAPHHTGLPPWLHRNPASAIPTTDTSPSLLGLRCPPSLFSYRLFLVVQWKTKSRGAHKVLLTFGWTSVSSVMVDWWKKISVPSPWSFPCSIAIQILLSDIEAGLLFPTTFASPGYFTSTLTVRQQKGMGTRWRLKPLSIEVYGHLSFRSSSIFLFLKTTATPAPWRKEKKGRESSTVKLGHFYIWRSHWPDRSSSAWPMQWLSKDTVTVVRKQVEWVPSCWRIKLRLVKGGKYIRLEAKYISGGGVT